MSHEKWINITLLKNNPPAGGNVRRSVVGFVIFVICRKAMLGYQVRHSWEINGEEMFNLVKWTGSEWGNCDSGITGDEEGMVSSLEVFDNKLFIFGIFDSANGINCNNAIVYTE